ncbi:MAG: hypothetical protein JOY59_11355 [Candidatus Eremiobacteraeota bacterium]|nr:hypothetical protein [Candidatus Eremiobacteraeota bacterium]
MSDLLVSLVESIAGALANAAENRRSANAPERPPAPMPPRTFRPAAPPAPRVTAPAVRPAPAPVMTPAAEVIHAHAPAVDVTAIFSHADRLLEALVISELLAPPIALRRDNRWGPPRVLGG